MFKKIRHFLERAKKEGPADPWLLFSAASLLIIGLVMLSSASAVVSYANFHNTYHYFFKQLLAVGVSLVFFTIFYFVDYRFWRRFAVWALLASIVLLILVFIPGLRSEYGTARSWIVIFGQSFQPAELVKLTFLIYLATWLEAKKGQLQEAGSGIIPFLSSLLIISALMMAQPDLGTLFIILFSSWPFLLPAANFLISLSLFY
jgi:cell division protein FtsW